MINRRRFIKKAVMAGIVSSAPSILLSKDNSLLSNSAIDSRAKQLYVGWSTADITPLKPVVLIGQMNTRISKSIEDPLNATVIALETRDNSGKGDAAIMVSCDLTYTRSQTQKKLQHVVSRRLPDFDVTKLFLNATHTHTAPGLIDNEFFELYDTGNDTSVMKPSEYEAFFIEKTADAVVDAWKNRKPGSFSWGLGNAILAHNRRTVKVDGTAKMYGVGDPDFLHYESIDDNKIPLLFFWDGNKKLTGMIINTTATAQVTDSTCFISSDFYHETREKIKKKYGKNIFVFFQIGSAGDSTPDVHEYIYSRAEQAMLRRKGISARQELADRILRCVDEVIPYVKNDSNTKIIFNHDVVKMELPVNNPPALPFYLVDDVNPAEFHILRLGDVAIATNPFELFNDYGLLIKAQSKAVLTFLVELCCHHSGYLPTEKAIKGGGYSADKYLVGPEGGYQLVKETVKRINQMWNIDK